MESQKRTLWPFVFGTISLIYVLMEFVFNADLVDLASSATPGADEMEAIALRGETLSGIGLAIALMTLLKLTKPLKDRGTLLSLGIFTVMAVFATVPFMRWAQPALIDSLVDKTTAEERSSALGLNLFKFGVAHGAIQLKGQQLGTTPEDKTLLALLGPMASGNQKIESIVQANQKTIFDRVLIGTANSTSASRWNEYQQIRQDVASKYNQYIDSAKKYEASLISASGKTGGQASNTLAAIRQGVEADYKRHLEAGRRFEDSLLAQESVVSAEVRKYAQSINSRSPSASYAPAMQHIYGFTPDIEQYLSIDGSRKLNEQTIRSGHLRQVDRAFALKSDGIPRKITLNQFLHHPTVCKKARAQVMAKGMSLPGNWCPDDEVAVTASVSNEAQKRVRAEWEKGTRAKFGQVVEPNLTESQFRSLPSVQRSIREALAKAPCTKGNAYLSAAQFKAACIASEFDKQRIELKSAFNAPVEQLGDDSTHSEKGRQAVKALVIPPVAMAISLFFSLLAAMNLLFKVLPNKAMFQSKYTKGAAFAALLVWPALAAPGKHSAMAELVLNDGHGYRGIYTWVMNAEPTVYKIGKAFSRDSSRKG